MVRNFEGSISKADLITYLGLGFYAAVEHGYKFTVFLYSVNTSKKALAPLHRNLFIL